jgi:hypothetical protein
VKNKNENTKVSQLDKANKALKDLAHNVISEDRKEAGVSEPTIVAYLKGEGKDLSTAMKLLRFFRKKISDREKELQGAA